MFAGAFPRSSGGCVCREVCQICAQVCLRRSTQVYVQSLRACAQVYVKNIGVAREVASVCRNIACMQSVCTEIQVFAGEVTSNYKSIACVQGGCAVFQHSILIPIYHPFQVFLPFSLSLLLHRIDFPFVISKKWNPNLHEVCFLLPILLFLGILFFPILLYNLNFNSHVEKIKTSEKRQFHMR